MFFLRAQVVGRAPVLSGDAPVAEAAAAAAAAEPRSTSKYYLGLEQLELRRKDMEIRPALSNGLVSDWDSLERLWSHLLLNQQQQTQALKSVSVRCKKATFQQFPPIKKVRYNGLWGHI